MSILMCLLMELSESGVSSSGSVSVVNSKIRNMKERVDTVMVMAGDTARIPCDVHNEDTSGQDRVKLVLWFRNMSDTPFYTFDAVNPKNPPQHWQNPEVSISYRSQFHPDESRSVLIIKKLLLEDSGRYKCRVDYFLEQTTFHLIDLKVVVPPEKPNIFLENGLSVNNRLSARLNSSISLKCESIGGFPPPNLTWWSNNKLLDSTFERLNNKVMNTVTIRSLSRQDVDSVLSCRAVNNNISGIVQTSIRLDLLLAPLSVDILDKEKQPIAGQNRTVTCRVIGARPTPVVKWFKNDYEIRGSSVTTSENGNITLSSIVISPRMSASLQDNRLSCVAHTPGLSMSSPGARLADSWNFTIHYSPIVSVKLGDSLNSSNIKEGDDVYFECNIQASPSVKSVIWNHNAETIHQDKTSGIIISGNSLVVQNIQRQNEGNYSCLAANHVASVESKPIILNIKYRPVCSNHLQTVFEANKLQTIKIDCNVVSNPGNGLHFVWSFNNSINSMDIPSGQVSSSGQSSSISYSPKTELDYGTLFCWASNIVGKGTPCVFTILPIGPPEPPSKCRTSNVTYSSFEISCDSVSSNPGNLFILQVDDMRGTHVKTLQSSWPQFTLGELQSGTTYKVNVRCENKHGRSDPLYLLVETLNEPIKQIAETKLKEENSEQNEVMAIIIGVTVSLMIMIVMVIIAVITVRVKSQISNNHHEMTRSDSDRRLSQSSHGYCTTISSDVAEFSMDGYHPLSRKQKPQKIIVKDGETYIPISSSCDSSCVLADCDYSPAVSDKVIHTPPPQYRGTYELADGAGTSSSGMIPRHGSGTKSSASVSQLDDNKTLPFESRC